MERLDEGSAVRKRVAVMQPYLFPYAGYYRLFAQVDEFVSFDCVQFPRRGRVHRTEVPGPDGVPEWLTLPLRRQPRDIRIRDLEFAHDARKTLDSRLGRLDWLADAKGPSADRVRELLYGRLESVSDFLHRSIDLTLDLLGIHSRITRSSTLDIDPALKGQDRVIAIVNHIGGTDYLNSPGGRALYDHDVFSSHGLRLSFLSDYSGPFNHFLHALVTEPADVLRDDICGYG